MTQADQSPSAPWFAAAQAVAPVIARWRDAAERERCLPGPLIEGTRDAGLFALAVDPRVGGAGLDDLALLKAIEELSSHDGSVGWNVMIAANGARIAAHLPECGLREVYAEGPSAVIAGSLLPKGMAEQVRGGFRVTGCCRNWDFSGRAHSGSDPACGCPVS